MNTALINYRKLEALIDFAQKLLASGDNYYVHETEIPLSALDQLTTEPADDDKNTQEKTCYAYRAILRGRIVDEARYKSYLDLLPQKIKDAHTDAELPDLDGDGIPEKIEVYENNTDENTKNPPSEGTYCDESGWNFFKIEQSLLLYIINFSTGKKMVVASDAWFIGGKK